MVYCDVMWTLECKNTCVASLSFILLLYFVVHLSREKCSEPSRSFGQSCSIWREIIQHVYCRVPRVLSLAASNCFPPLTLMKMKYKCEEKGAEAFLYVLWFWKLQCFLCICIVCWYCKYLLHILLKDFIWYSNGKQPWSWKNTTILLFRSEPFGT